MPVYYGQKISTVKFSLEGYKLEVKCKNILKLISSLKNAKNGEI